MPRSVKRGKRAHLEATRKVHSLKRASCSATFHDLGVEPQHETGLTNQEADNLVHLDELSTDVEVSEQNLGFLKGRWVLALSFACWTIGLYWFYTLEFAIVYVLFSLLALLFSSLATETSSDRRKTKNLSAYSVFNPDCEQLPGTYTATEVHSYQSVF